MADTAGQKLFAMTPLPRPDGLADTFQLADNGLELSLVQGLLEALGKDFELPKERRSHAMGHRITHRPESTPDIERKALWLMATASWKEAVPEWPLLRSMMVLHKLMLEVVMLSIYFAMVIVLLFVI